MGQDKYQNSKSLSQDTSPPTPLPAGGARGEGSGTGSQYDPPTGCFLRLFWMMVGNMILLLSLFAIGRHPTGGLALIDAFYWVIVASLLAARYIDIRHLHGLTADGDPATMAHWRRYASALGAVSAGLWLGAHALAYYGTQEVIQEGT